MHKALIIVGILLSSSALAQKTTISFWNFDTNAVQKAFWADQIRKFEAQNPGIDIQYTAYPSNQYDAQLEQAVKKGTLPDVVDVRDQGSVYRYINRKAFQPLDPYMDAKWQDRFYLGSFLNGLHKFKGKTYTYPYRDEGVNGVRTLVFYNKKLLADAGVKTLPKTWAEMRQMARAVTEKSKGNAYGFMMPFLQSGTENTVAAFAATAGQANGGALGGIQLRGLNLKTGTYNLSGEPFSKTVDFLNSLVKDGSMHPGYETSTNDQGVTLFTQGRVAMLTGPGFWAIPAVNAANPNFDWDIGVPPSPDGVKRPLHSAPSAGRIFMSARMKNPQAAWKWIDFMTSTPFLQAMIEEGISFPAQYAPYIAAKIDPKTKTVFALADQSVAVAPSVDVRNYGLATLLLAKVKPPQTSDLDLWRGAISGKLDYAEAARTFDNYMNSQLDAAIRRMSSTLDRKFLYSFPNWNPSRSFTALDYGKSQSSRGASTLKGEPLMRKTLTLLSLLLATSALAQKTSISFWNFDTNAVQKAFWADQIKKFEAQNPGIDIQYTAHPSNQYDNALELAIRGGNVPDVVDVRDQGAVYRYVNRGVFQPLDPYINQAWLNRFNPGDFLLGLHKFGGKVYSYPYRDERINGVRTLVFYNKKLLADAGVKTLPKTWAEMRQAAKAVTEKSKGNAYGFMMPFLQSGTENTVAAFASSAGPERWAASICAA